MKNSPTPTTGHWNILDIYSPGKKCRTSLPNSRTTELPMDREDRRHVLIGLIGAGIGGSLSPVMHEREGQLQGLSYFYQRIDLKELGLTAEALPELLSAAQRMAFTGLNITHPCKQRVIDCLDAFSGETRAIGSVNTVKFKDGKRIGHNTDGPAFIRSFNEELSGLPARVDPALRGGRRRGRHCAHALEDVRDARNRLRRRSGPLRFPGRPSWPGSMARIESGNRALARSHRGDGRVHQRDAARHDRESRAAHTRPASEPFILGRRHRLLSAGNEADRSPRALRVVGSWAAAEWLSIRPRPPSRSSPASVRIPSRMRQHFRDLTAQNFECRADPALGNQPSQMHT